MSENSKIIDAEFEYVAGPMRVGDEHPIRKGWFMTDKVGRKGEILWYRPPSKLNKAIHTGAKVVYVLLILFGIAVTLLTGGV